MNENNIIKEITLPQSQLIVNLKPLASWVPVSYRPCLRDKIKAASQFPITTSLTLACRQERKSPAH